MYNIIVNKHNLRDRSTNSKPSDKSLEFNIPWKTISWSTFMLQMQSSSSDVFEGWPLVNLGPSLGLLETVDRLVILRDDCFGALVVILPLIMVVKFNYGFQIIYTNKLRIWNRIHKHKLHELSFVLENQMLLRRSGNFPIVIVETDSLSCIFSLLLELHRLQSGL